MPGKARVTEKRTGASALGASRLFYVLTVLTPANTRRIHSAPALLMKIYLNL